MVATFDYGVGQLRDLQIPPAVPASDGEASHRHRAVNQADTLLLHGQPVKTTQRFWSSLQIRFGFTANIFRYFDHAEVFQRISQKSADDKIRWTLEHKPNATMPTLLAVSNPKAANIRRDELDNLLDRHETKSSTYHNGVVRSFHAPKHASPFIISGDGFEAQYVIETPIDGFGRPSVYLAMLRQICTNGAIAMTPAFRSEINLGRGNQNATFALERAMEGFNNEEGFLALRQRFESSTRSWASVNEVTRLGRIVGDMVRTKEVPERISTAKGGDGASEGDGISVFGAFGKLTGDMTHIYGLANLDGMNAKQQRTLPAACRVYDLLNFASELATHHAKPAGGKKIQAYIGELVSSEYDLENTVDHYADWRDFFLSDTVKTKSRSARN